MAKSAGGVLAIAGLGLLVVFAVLVLLMGVIKLMGVFLKDKAAPAEVAPAAAAEAPAAPVAEAPGSCGEVKLFDVPDKTAAMLMAITADKLGEPLNTLRFISIKEVK
ncbi:MAG: OadG family protein [Clostridia bacterium]|nr:OadG family protein [Clostridia bacterium]